MFPKKLQAYLDWHVHLFRVNRAHERLDLTTKVMYHALRSVKAFRSLGWMGYHLLSKALKNKRI